MPTDNRSSLFILLLGIVSVLYPTLTATHNESSTTTSALEALAPRTPLATNKRTPSPPDGGALTDDAFPGGFCHEQMLAPMLEFHRTSDKLATSSSDGGPVPDVLRNAWPDEESVEFLIATVPDPIDSGLAYDFDRDLEALQLAVEKDGRLRDRSWLPWNPVAMSAADAERTRACRKEVPGVVLFRRSRGDAGADSSLFVLLLVGETPTWGVHSAALTRALDFASLARKDAPPSLRIVAPSFSGSSQSMRHAVSAWYEARRAKHPKPDTFTFMSGTATSPSNRTVLTTSADAGAPKLKFASTTVPDDALACAFYRYLQGELGVDESDTKKHLLAHVALLHESGTEYGSTFDNSKRALDGGVADTCPRPEASFGFPPHISSLRSAYDSAQRKAQADKAAAADNPALPTTRLDPSLEESNPPLDVEPTLSNKTTYSHDVVLSNLLREIAKRDVHYLGLVATDPADVIFLAQQIHKVVPDIRLFVFGSEIFYLHPSFAGELEGMFVVSPYPFFGASEFRRDADGRTHTTFSGQAPQGLYNATRAQLSDGGTAELVEYPAPGSPGDAGLPVWISVVGRGALVPLRAESYGAGAAEYVLGPIGRDAPASSDGGSGWAESAPKLWQLAVFVLSIFGLANVYGFAAYNVGRNRRLGQHAHPAVPLLRFFNRFEICVHNEERLKQSYYLFATFVALTIAHFTLLSGTSAWLTKGLSCVTTVIGFLAGIVVAIAALVAFVNVIAEVRAYVNDGLETDRRRMATIIAALTTGAFLVAIAWLVALVMMTGSFQKDDAQFPIFAERATRLAGGVSPIAPVVLAALCMYVWGLCQLTRVQLLDTLQVRTPHAPPPAIDPATPPSSGEGARADEKKEKDDAVATAVGGVRAAAEATADASLEAMGDPPSTSGLGLELDRSSQPGESGFRVDFGVLLRAVVRTLGSTVDAGWPYWLGSLTLAAMALFIFLLKPPLIFEGGAGKALLVGAFSALVLATGSGIVRLALFFIRLRALLRRLARHALVDAFARLPVALSRSVETQVSAPASDVNDLVLPVRQAELLARRASALRDANMPAEPTPASGETETTEGRALDHDAKPTQMDRERAMQLAIVARLDDLQRCVAGERRADEQKFTSEGRAIGDVLRDELSTSAADRVRVDLGDSETMRRLAAASTILWDVLEPFWDGRVPLGTKRADATADEGKESLTTGVALSAYAGFLSADARAWLSLAEELVAAHVGFVLTHLLRHFRHFSTMVTAGAFTMLLFISSYAMQPKRVLLTFVWVVMLSAVGTGMYVFFELERDEVLSRIGKKPEPGKIKISGALLGRVFAWGVLPILGVAAAQYPEFGRTVFAWLAPVTKILH